MPATPTTSPPRPTTLPALIDFAAMASLNALLDTLEFFRNLPDDADPKTKLAFARESRLAATALARLTIAPPPRANSKPKKEPPKKKQFTDNLIIDRWYPTDGPGRKPWPLGGFWGRGPGTQPTPDHNTESDDTTPTPPSTSSPSPPEPSAPAPPEKSLPDLSCPSSSPNLKFEISNSDLPPTPSCLSSSPSNPSNPSSSSSRLPPSSPHLKFEISNSDLPPPPSCLSSSPFEPFEFLFPPSFESSSSQI